MKQYEPRDLITQGKTKRIWEVTGDKSLAIIENKKSITAFDDPSKTREFETKAVHSTTTTCRVFELLKAGGIPVAYVQQLSSTEFVTAKCSMIPLEVVARRYGVGSYLKRHPNLIAVEGEMPWRFPRLETEFFLKTTGGMLVIADKTLVDGLDPASGEEDPFIANPYDDQWKLMHPKKPAWDESSDLAKSIDPSALFVTGWHTRMNNMEDLLRQVFLVLEGAWNKLGLRLIDMKIEFGLTDTGELVVADVIDNDSWRLRDASWQELSKEAFRQGEDLSEVEHKYGIVARLVEQFRVPRQALVLWRGSKSDDWPPLPKQFAESGVDIVEVTQSGHKATARCLQKLQDILTRYPDGGVIITKVGRSNGLGPILAAHTSWPLMSIPATLDTHPEDIWSSIRMPSDVPLLTAWPEKNAVLAAANILASSNPLLYAWRQQSIEKLDF